MDGTCQRKEVYGEKRKRKRKRKNKVEEIQPANVASLGVQFLQEERKYQPAFLLVFMGHM